MTTAEAVQLEAFLSAMLHYSPTIPDELVEYYLQRVGFSSHDVRVTRLISLAVHKLLVDVIHDAMQYQRIRSQTTSSSTTGSGSLALSAAPTSDGASPTDTRAVLTMEDLAASLKEYGINICRPEYVSDTADDPATY
ncbi:transcription initiation factor tfiid [Plasmopara halstedii]|uniref:Transcription initiation factor tfiid n=1 Tax=Plasmopara halstedii TaxID=4781 RepID=A0A0P1ANI3_PLAHL|nr:transcription initiation factor tfiid [Plasmopara halstedii]CEG42544.1 transcription initiation factor tfiid [Plasmopara halstedii]|eukprot:XP_024578913.1 transcription initiation factor tfiid [Plasmopara halstedii]